MYMMPPPESLHPLVLRALEKCSQRPIPLVRTRTVESELSTELANTGAPILFPHTRNATSAMSGLMLAVGDWERSHAFSQEDSSLEGSYWHAIAHRIEPDSSSAAYWFRRVGSIPIFPDLYAEAGTTLAGNRCGFNFSKKSGMQRSSLSGAI